MPAPPLALYHGTSRVFDGPPSRGDKDVLSTGYLSMTPYPDVAEFFAGGNRHARIYTLQVPRTAILDLRKESAELGEREEWDRLSALINEAGSSGKYQAVALTDITFGTDDTEFRLIRPVAPEQWQVERSQESVEEYAEFDDIVRRVTAGETVSRAERERAMRRLKSDAKADFEVAEVMEDEDDPAAALLKDRVAQDKELYQVLKAEPTAPAGAQDRDTVGGARMEEYEGVLKDPRTGETVEVAIRKPHAQPAAQDPQASEPPAPPMAQEPAGALAPLDGQPSAPSEPQDPQASGPTGPDAMEQVAAPVDAIAPLGAAQEQPAEAARSMRDRLQEGALGAAGRARQLPRTLQPKYAAALSKLREMRGPAAAAQRAGQAQATASIVGEKYVGGRPAPPPRAKQQKKSPKMRELEHKMQRIRGVFGGEALPPPAPDPRRRRRQTPKLREPRSRPPKMKIIRK